MESNITLRQGLEKFRNEYKHRLSHDKYDSSNEAGTLKGHSLQTANQ